MRAMRKFGLATDCPLCGRVFFTYGMARHLKACKRKLADQDARDMYQPKTGARCGCKRGVQRDNCPTCEGTGWVIDFKAIHARREVK